MTCEKHLRDNINLHSNFFVRQYFNIIYRSCKLHKEIKAKIKKIIQILNGFVIELTSDKDNAY